MGDYLPDYAAPHITLQINGIFYQYTMNKDKDADATVHIRNKHIDGGYIFSKTDEWSGKHGGTLRKFYTFAGSDASLWGDGEMKVEGDGSITDPSMIYSYRMDIGEEEVKCSTPLADPSCPGFVNALYKYLEENGLLGLSEDDELYEAWLASQAELEEEEKDEEPTQEEEEEKLEFENRLMIESGNQLALSDQDVLIQQLNNSPYIESYYSTTIPGGDLGYYDQVTLQDATLPDNRRAMRNLASDAKHRTMVRSQYEREQ